MEKVAYAIRRGNVWFFRDKRKNSRFIREYLREYRLAIHTVTETGQEEVVRILIEFFGVDVGVTNSSGAAALHIATAFGHAAIARMLVKEYGADINHRDRAGNSALIWATSGRDKKLARVLVACGAAPTNKWRSEWTTPEVAAGLRDRDQAPLQTAVSNALLPLLGETGVCDIISGYAEDTVQDWLERGPSDALWKLRYALYDALPSISERGVCDIISGCVDEPQRDLQIRQLYKDKIPIVFFFLWFFINSESRETRRWCVSRAQCSRAERSSLPARRARWSRQTGGYSESPESPAPRCGQ